MLRRLLPLLLASTLIACGESAPAGDSGSSGSTGVPSLTTGNASAGVTTSSGSSSSGSTSSGSSDSGSTSSGSTGSTASSTSGSIGSSGSSGSTGSACVADVALDTSTWSTSPSLVINYAHTVEYRCDWYSNGTIWKSYDFVTCDGWISDVFIAGSGSRAVVGWNLVTNAMFTQQDGTNPYDAQVAHDCASWAVQTIFPAGDLSNLDIR